MPLLVVRNFCGINQTITDDVGGIFKVWGPVFDDTEVNPASLLISYENRLLDSHVSPFELILRVMYFISYEGVHA